MSDTLRMAKTARLQALLADYPDVDDFLEQLAMLADAADPTPSAPTGETPSTEARMPGQSTAWARGKTDRVVSDLQRLTTKVEAWLDIPLEERTVADSDGLCTTCGRRPPARTSYSAQSKWAGKLSQGQHNRLEALAVAGWPSISVFEAEQGIRDGIENLSRQDARRLLRRLRRERE